MSSILVPEAAEIRKPFESVRQIDAGLLNVGYVDVGPADGRAVLLLHGWPYDILSYLEVAPLLAARGYRVVVPYLRGYGTTRFRAAETFRNGQPAALAVDAIALMDALEIKQAVLGGFDWGARTADIVAALWPERCRGLVSVSGYLIGSQDAGRLPLPPEAELQWWYQYYFATERGQAGYEEYRREFAKLIWRTASPRWDFDDATFDRSAASFENPDHVAIVIHNYRWRLGLAEGEVEYDHLEQRLVDGPSITVPTITLEGGPQQSLSSSERPRGLGVLCGALRNQKVIRMARLLEAFPAPPTQRYPWDEWLDGRPRELLAGEGYTAKTRTLVATARMQAKKRGGTVRTRLIATDSGSESLILQFRGSSL